MIWPLLKQHSKEESEYLLFTSSAYILIPSGEGRVFLAGPSPPSCREILSVWPQGHGSRGDLLSPGQQRQFPRPSAETPRYWLVTNPSLETPQEVEPYEFLVFGKF